MTTLTIEEKYNWLLKQLRITDVDLWEQDALLKMDSVYFQFSKEPLTTDEAVELAINDWYRHKEKTIE